MNYILWINYGYEGWSPTEYETLEECLNGAMKNAYGNEFKITKKIDYKITEAKIEASENE